VLLEPPMVAWRFSDRLFNANFLYFLVDDVLENSSFSKFKEDRAAAKVHSVKILKLLVDHPAFGMNFQMILDGIPASKRYKAQDHSLIITGPEQKTDYFLTDGFFGRTEG
jgi:hypothetical protein